MNESRMKVSGSVDRSRAFEFACAVCGWEMTAMVLRLMAGPPPADDVIAACPQGHYSEYRRENPKANGREFDLACTHANCLRKGTYRLPVRCSNCGTEGVGIFTKTHEATVKRCPVCENESLCVTDRVLVTEANPE